MKSQDIMRQATEHETANETSPSSVSFLFSDFHLQRNEIEGMIRNIQTPIFAAGEGVAEPGVVHLFDSQEAFDQWASRTRFAKKFQEVGEIVRRARQGMPVDLPQRSVRVVANTPLELNRDIRTREQQMEQNMPIGAALYEEEGFQGKSLTTGATAIGDLSDIEFFKRASSIKVSGVCLLTDQVQFGGARLYLIGDPQLNIADLRDWGFKNCAASVIVL